MDLVGRPETEALTRPHVDDIAHRRDVPVVDRSEARPLRGVIAHEAIGTLIGATPPGVVGQDEEELDAAGDLG